jgi:hypothetical protein
MGEQPRATEDGQLRGPAPSSDLRARLGRLVTGYTPMAGREPGDGDPGAARHATAAPLQARRLPWQRGVFGSSSPVGAVVVGGGFLGLGIARSLGRQGIPVCVIDDGPSITRASRYVTTTVRVPDLLEDEAAVSAVLDVGARLGLDGWVLYPTRDETVAAFARHKERLETRFRVRSRPTRAFAGHGTSARPTRWPSASASLRHAPGAPWTPGSSRASTSTSRWSSSLPSRSTSSTPRT